MPEVGRKWRRAQPGATFVTGDGVRSRWTRDPTPAPIVELRPG